MYIYIYSEREFVLGNKHQIMKWDDTKHVLIGRKILQICLLNTCSFKLFFLRWIKLQNAFVSKINEFNELYNSNDDRLTGKINNYDLKKNSLRFQL